MTRFLNRIFLAVTALAVALLGWCSLTDLDGERLGPSVVLEQPSGRLVDATQGATATADPQAVLAPDPATGEPAKGVAPLSEQSAEASAKDTDQPDAEPTPAKPVAAAGDAQVADPAAPVIEDPATPSETTPAEQEAPAIPRFDIVRVDADGQTVIAGKAAPGERVEVLIDGAVVGDAVADEQGAFVAVIFADLSGQAQHLQLRTLAPPSVGGGAASVAAEPSVAQTASQPQIQGVGVAAPDQPAAVSDPVATAPSIAREPRSNATGQDASAGAQTVETGGPVVAATPEALSNATEAEDKTVANVQAESGSVSVTTAGPSTTAPSVNSSVAPALASQEPGGAVAAQSEPTTPPVEAGTPAPDTTSAVKPERALTASEGQGAPSQPTTTEMSSEQAEPQEPTLATSASQTDPEANTGTASPPKDQEPVAPAASTDARGSAAKAGDPVSATPQPSADIAPVTRIGDLALANPNAPDQAGSGSGSGIGVRTGGDSAPGLPVPSTGGALLSGGALSPSDNARPQGASVPTEAPGPQFVLSAPVIILPSSQPDAAPTLVQPRTEELAVLQPGGGQVDGIVLDRITYGETGNVQLSGRARADRTVRIYGNAIVLDTIRTNREGAWSWSLAPDRASEIKLFRFDEIAADGSVSSRIETPFAYSVLSPQVLRERRVVVQKGDMLWRIAEQFYGEGLRFSLIYGANEALIRDPDLIYPGQVFSIPELVDAQ